MALLLGPGAEAKKLLPTADGISPAGMLHAMHERMHAKMKAKAGSKAQVLLYRLKFSSAAPWLIFSLSVHLARSSRSPLDEHSVFSGSCDF